MAYRTLGELSQELNDRLGFGGAGSAGNVNRRIRASFLRDAQWQLYWQAEWPALTNVANFSIPSGTSNVTYDAGWNPDRIIRMMVNIGSVGSPQWLPVDEGIELEEYNSSVIPGYPTRYERRALGFEFTPERDAAYTGKIKYMSPLNRFTEDGDRASIDDGIVFLMALANAKAHYKHRDADVYASQLTAVLTRLKSTQWGNKRFLPSDRQMPQPLPRPQVV